MEHLLAQADYQMLAPIPQLLKAGSNATSTVNSFVEGIVPLIIGIAGGLAVIRIIVGGIQYMSTDAWGGKKEAKGTITNAIVGLLLVIGAYTLLNTINPTLVNFDLEIEGLATGGAIDPNAGGTTAKGAEELGCTDCEELTADDLPLRYGACSNEPCFLNENLLEELVDDLKPHLQNNASSTWRSLQIIKAFPNTASSTSPLDSCFRLGSNGQGGANAGTCVDIALTIQDIERLKVLLDAVGSQVQQGYTYTFINACGARGTQLRASNQLSAYPDNLFFCHFPERGEFVRIQKQ